MTSVAGLRDFGISFDEEISLPRSDIILKLAISDPEKLWRAAARRLEVTGLGKDDLEDTIGSIDDPQIEDCLIAVMMPFQVEGCDLVEFQVQAASAG